MLHDILKAYPDLGSFFYGHWDSFAIGSDGFIVLMLVLLALAALLLVGGAVTYVLQAIAMVRIAKKQGAWRNIRIMACLPFARHFAFGKLAERSDAILLARDTDAKRRLWGRVLLLVGCLVVPVFTVMAVIAAVGLPGAQIFVLVVESSDEITRNLGKVGSILYVALVILALPILLVRWVLEDLFLLALVVLPIAGIVCLLAGIVLLAIIRTVNGICLYKVLCLYYEKKSALIRAVIGAVTGLSSAVLLAASYKKAE